jgi:hypothetical protein
LQLNDIRDIHGRLWLGCCSRNLYLDFRFDLSRRGALERNRNSKVQAAVPAL